MEVQRMMGVLEFSGLWPKRPWALVQSDGTKVDLYPLIRQVLDELNGKPATYRWEADSFHLAADDSADTLLQNDTVGAQLIGINFFKMSNVGVFLSDALTWLSGRKVTFAVDDTSFTIEADPAEEVPSVERFGGGNSCRIPDGAEKTRCKIGTRECCIFAVVGGNGFSCEKFGGLGQHLLYRHFKGEMNASRIGNCRLAVRK